MIGSNPQDVRQQPQECSTTEVDCTGAPRSCRRIHRAAVGAEPRLRAPRADTLLRAVSASQECGQESQVGRKPTDLARIGKGSTKPQVRLKTPRKNQSPEVNKERFED